MRAAVFVVLGQLVASLAVSQWQVVTYADPISDESAAGAAVRNDQGFTLTVYRQEASEQIRAVFRLATGNPDFLSAERSPAFRIDGRALQEAPRLDGDLKWTVLLLWHGKAEPVIGVLRDLMQGESLVVRYFLYGGGYKETSFSLGGAAEAISQALGIRATVSAEEQKTARVLDTALQRCLSMPKKRAYLRCMEAITACSAQELASAQAMRACLAGAEG